MIHCNYFKKEFSVIIVFLFISIVIIPSINFNVAKASSDNDLVKVTTQACGIKGFGNTTVKLTRQQYQNLEQYLVDFRERLNRTTTREEAVPLFKDAVVEFNKYELLPQRTDIKQVFNQIIKKNLDSKKHTLFLNEEENFLCLIAGETTCTRFRPLTGIPIKLFSTILFGDYISYPDIAYESSKGWIHTFGLAGKKSWNGSFYGQISVFPGFHFIQFYTGVIGFTGIRISAGELRQYTFIGTAIRVGIGPIPPP